MYKFPINSIKQILASNSENVTVSGWLSTVRSQKHTTFMNLVDGSNISGIQLVMDNQPHLTTGTAVRATGKLQPYKNGVEVLVEKLEILGKVNDGYPLHKGRIPLDKLRQFPHLRQRTTTFGAIARVRSGLIKSIDLFMEQSGFITVNPPILTSNDCEGGGEAFKVSASKRDFFDKNVYLTVSSQLHLEFMASAMSRVYTIQNCFRAEPSDSTRHLAEFGMLEVEMAFVDLEQLMDFCEAQIKFTINYLLSNFNEEMEFFDKYVHMGLLAELGRYAKEPFVRITYDDAVTLLLKQDNVEWKYPLQHGLELQTEHEKYLVESIFHKPVFVTNYPSSVKPFYMKTTGDGKALCMDLLMPRWGEVVGGSLREDDYGKLLESVKSHGLESADYDWYLDLRKYGSVPHGGYGLGVERLLGLCTGISNIKDLVPAPRFSGNCKY